ncbi:response regulator transcription factor [Streptomyces sp. N50]|uniref:response regulator transcription factor n=1 Tax=Streptomyces sp. N50 TaxID=3081765 RepID=UPI002961FB0F|nr:response regulator transcription factor [Streptomyces sp. N50]WOX15489.1 response regulator transcription factor [Streptomyces sp. N50]
MRVVIAEDSALLRAGVVRLLTDEGVKVVAQLGDAQNIIEAVRQGTPDVVILDLRMPPSFVDEGFRAALDLLNHFPDVGILLLSQYVEHSYAEELVRRATGGVGYLLKQRVGDFEEFLSAVERVRRGETVLDSEIYRMFVGSPRERHAADLLTPRELQVLELMATGLTNSGIVGRLGISERAVEKHVTSILAKLRIPNSGENHRRVLAVLDYLRGVKRRHGSGD